MRYIFIILFLALTTLNALHVEEDEAKRLCNIEIAKEHINVILTQKYCIKAAVLAKKNKEYEYASWYYVLGGDLETNINELEVEISDISTSLYANLAHSYLLNHDVKKAKKLYMKFLSSLAVPIVDIAIQDDYKLLFQLYPNNKEILNEGLTFWNSIYKPYISINGPYSKYLEAKEKKKSNEAIRYLLDVIALLNKIPNIDAMNIAYNQYSLGIIYNEKMEYQKSLDSLEKAEEVFEVHEQYKVTYAYLLGLIADNYEELKKDDKAIAYYEKSLSIKKRQGTFTQDSLVYTYTRLAVLSKNTKYYMKSLKYYKKILLVEEKKTDSRKNFRLSNLYTRIGDVLANSGEIDDALMYYKKSLDLKELIGMDDMLTTDTYRNIAKMYLYKSNFSISIEYFEKAILMASQNKKDSDVLLISLYSYIAYAYTIQAKYKESLLYYNRALDIQKVLPNTVLSDIASTYESIAEVYENIGLNSKSVYYYNKAVENLQDNNRTLSWQAYENLGDLYSNLNNIKEATNNYTKAIKALESAAVEISVNDSSNLKNLADIYVKVGRKKKAIDLYVMAYKIQKKTYKNGNYITSNIKKTIANLYAYSGPKSRKLAIKYYLQVLDEQKKSLGETHYGLSDTMYRLAITYEKDQAYYNAIKYLLLSLDISKTNPARVLSLYQSLARLYKKDNKPKKAFKYTMKAFETFVKKKDTYFNILSAKEKSEFIVAMNKSIVICFYDTAIAIDSDKYQKLYDIPDWLRGSFDIIDTNETTKAQKKRWKGVKELEEKENKTRKEKNIQLLFTHWLNYKGSILDSENSISTLYEQTKDPKIKESIETLRDNKVYLAKLFQEYPNKEQTNAHQENIQLTKDKIDEIERELSSKVESFKEAMNLRVLTLDNIAKYLKPNELYIDYAKAGDNYYLFTMNNKKDVSFSQIDTNDTKAIESSIQAFRDQTKYMSTNLSKLKDKEIQELKQMSIANLSKLYKLLIDKPIGKTIKDYNSLIISPDGALSLLPFESLYDNDTQHYIIQDKAIRYIPSGKEFVRLNRRAELSNEDVVVFANPDFQMKLPKDIKGVNIQRLITPNTQSRGIDLNWEGITQLNGSKEEANFIKKKYKKQALMFTEDKAKESNLLKVKEPKILHLSTHGYFLNDKSITNPMLKSGILLSGAQRTFKHEEDGGVISALRLSGLNLKGTELVMLSACETGVADVSSGGEGVSGLNKAFLQAGASDVAMTLWSVADKETADLIKEFYNNIKDKNYNEALREAKLEFINDKDNTRKTHPYYWAGFIVSGR